MSACKFVLILLLAASCRAHQASGRFFFNTLTITVGTTTPTTTSTPTCWTTTTTPTDPCNGIRRRRGLLDADDYALDDEEPHQFDKLTKSARSYHHYYPEATLSDVRRRPLWKLRPANDQVEETANRWLLSFVTSTAPTVTVQFSSTSTTTIACLNPSKITKC